MSIRRGIILAGGTGSRLHPVTRCVSKQLLPVYDKPMIYYPLSVLMLGGVREIAIITTPNDQDQFKKLLGDGSQLGIEISYLEQAEPKGLAQAYLLAEGFLAGGPSAMVLGDNIFFGHGLSQLLQEANNSTNGGTVFGYQVADPSRYGVVGYDASGKVTSIIEKPSKPLSNLAVTGLYYLDGTGSEKASRVTLSERGEYEITSLLEMYLHEGSLNVQRMGRGYAWLDTGTHESLLDAGNFVRTLEKRQGVQVGCPEEIAFLRKWISADQLGSIAAEYSKSNYGRYLESLIA